MQIYVKTMKKQNKFLSKNPCGCRRDVFIKEYTS